MVLKAEASFTMGKKKDKIDKKTLVFVKIFVDVFQGITKSCQAPPFPPLLSPNASIFG